MNQFSYCSTIQNHLLSTEALGEEDVRHIRSCENCRALIARAAELESMLADAEIPGDDEVQIFRETERSAVGLVVRRSTTRFIIDVALAMLIATGAILWTILAGLYLGTSSVAYPRTRSEFLIGALPEIFVLTAILGAVLGLSIGRMQMRSRTAATPKWAALVPLLFVLVFLAEYRFARFLARDHEPWFALAIALCMLTAAAGGYLPATLGLPYKRLREGRMLSGVCLGIAERTRISVGLIRLVILALLFAKLSGLLLYVVLDLLMQVHPDDRSGLLRFRLRRWWSGYVSRRASWDQP